MIGLCAAPTLAQRPQTIVRVHVVDTAEVSVPSAEVSVLYGLKAVIASARTDSQGAARLVVERGDELQVSVRRLGFERRTQFIYPEADSFSVIIRLIPMATELAPVQVTATEDFKRKHFHIGADEIEASPRPILSGLDVVTKLRPEMMDPPGGKGRFTRCGMYNLWINGERIVFPPIDAGVATKAIAIRRVQLSTPFHLIGPSGLGATPISVQSALERIRPEHIAEITYVKCGDATVDRVAADNAVFVTLKPGVKYDMLRGSFVSSPASPEPLFTRSPTNSATAFRNRLLGVFDLLTGDAIAGVRITDSTSGTYTTTDSTGTIFLAFLPEGVSTIQLRHADYEDLTLQVTISPKDTVPLTLLLLRRK
jgi:hypothetical protein